jgi:hypothetical protein
MNEKPETDLTMQTKKIIEKGQREIAQGLLEQMYSFPRDENGQIDWYSLLKDDEKETDITTKQEYVKLSGLWRLARLKGIKKTYVNVYQVPQKNIIFSEKCPVCNGTGKEDKEKCRMCEGKKVIFIEGGGDSTVSFQIEFNDGEIFTALGHANSTNCCDEFKKYPVTIAESRAKARACRDALGIQICSVEERNEDEDMQQKLTSVQLEMIKILMGRRGITEEELVSSGSRKVGKIEDLTRIEAQTTIQWLNKQPEKTKK